MSTVTVALAFVSALGSGLVAGVFFAFSTFVMRALARLEPAEGIRAMQHINVTVITPLFMAALFGTGLTCFALIVAALLDWDGSYGPYLVAGGALYVVGTLVVTMAFNVPRNDELASLDPAAPGSDAVWKRYLAEWTAWNHVRTVAPLVARGCWWRRCTSAVDECQLRWAGRVREPAGSVDLAGAGGSRRCWVYLGALQIARIHFDALEGHKGVFR